MDLSVLILSTQSVNFSWESHTFLLSTSVFFMILIMFLLEDSAWPFPWV